MHAPTERPHPSRGTILLLGSLTAFGALSIDLYLPALPAIARGFGVDAAAAQRTLVGFFIGIAIGQLFYGPISDRVGRRPPLLFGVGLYILASIGCALAPSIEWLIAGRFVQGLGCCAGMVVARSVVRDRFDHQDSARIFSLLTLVLGVAPMIAPTVGGWLVVHISWRWLFAVLAVFGAAIGAAVWFRLEESRSAATAAKAHAETPLRAYADLLSRRRLIGYLLVSALNGATLFSYVAGSPDVVITIWGFTTAQFGLVFAAIAFGVIGSSQVNRWLLGRHAADRILAVAAPMGALCGLALLAGALAGLGTWPMLGLFFLTLTSNGFIGANALAGALSVDPLRSGSASGLFGSSSFLVGAAAASLAGAFHDGTVVPLAAVMAGSLVSGTIALYALALPRRGEDTLA